MIALIVNELATNYAIKMLVIFVTILQAKI
jgi:hypothetical protein